MSGSNFTNGSLVMRIWRFDGSGEVLAKFQYFSDATHFADSMVTRDTERKANEEGAYFYLSVCDNENAMKAHFAKREAS